MLFSPSEKKERLHENPSLKDLHRDANLLHAVPLYFRKRNASYAPPFPHSQQALSCPFPFYGGNSVPSYTTAAAAFRKAAPRSVPLPLPAISHPPTALCFPTSGYYSSSLHLRYSVFLIVAQLSRQAQGAYLINFLDLF